MRAHGKDIIELFGYAADDTSGAARQHFRAKSCPFIGSNCSKTNHDQSVVYGTCSVTAGKGKEIIICPKRLYAKNYAVFSDVVKSIWGAIPLVVGGDLAELRKEAVKHSESVVAFGQNSGKEITVQSNGKLSIDWVLQRYKNVNGRLAPQDFVGVEVQSIDITGNYRENFHAYEQLKNGTPPNYIPDAGHGLNWANVHKRLIPQIIRKGNIYNRIDRCAGFAFILPTLVYEKFDEILGDLDEKSGSSNDNLSVFTYSLDTNTQHGSIRGIKLDAIKHHSLRDIASAFSSNSGENSHKELDRTLRNILY